MSPSHYLLELCKRAHHVILLVNTFIDQKATGAVQESLFSELVPLGALRTDM